MAYYLNEKAIKLLIFIVSCSFLCVLTVIKFESDQRIRLKRDKFDSNSLFTMIFFTINSLP